MYMLRSIEAKEAPTLAKRGHMHGHGQGGKQQQPENVAVRSSGRKMPT